MSALWIIPILAVLILVHEFGHFITAKMVGIKVEEFGLGIPPRIKGFTYRGVLYSINLIPLGGFVRVLGEDGKSEAPDSMQAKGKLQRTLFITAGSIMNLLLAIVLMIAIVGVQGQTTNHVYVYQVQPDSPAQSANWQPGDRVIAVEGKKISSADQLIALTADYAGKPMTTTLERDGKDVQSTLVPRVNPPKDSGRAGVLIQEASAAVVTIDSIQAHSPASAAGFQPGDVVTRIDGQPIVDGTVYSLMLDQSVGKTVPVVVNRGGQPRTLQLAVPKKLPHESTVDVGFQLKANLIYSSVPWYDVVPQGFHETWTAATQMFQGLKMLVQGSAPLSDVAGPIGMGQLTSEVISASAAPLWVTLSQITILLSLNLAVLNLLPFPALDGGRLLFVIIEFVRGKKVSPEKEGMVHFVGLIILLLVMFVVAFGDIGRLMSGTPFLK